MTRLARLDVETFAALIDVEPEGPEIWEQHAESDAARDVLDREGRVECVRLPLAHSERVEVGAQRAAAQSSRDLPPPQRLTTVAYRFTLRFYARNSYLGLVSGLVSD